MEGGRGGACKERMKGKKTKGERIFFWDACFFFFLVSESDVCEWEKNKKKAFFRHERVSHLKGRFASPNAVTPT